MKTKKMKLYDTLNEYLECEKWWVFTILMSVSGFYGAFTYSIRGGVFCNAQTANFVLFAMALGRAQWTHAFYFLIPMSAYFLGSLLSESLPRSIKKLGLIRWDTLLIFIEMLVVIFLANLPESAPYQISQVLINFICSMQYNTFRQAQSIPMATTFCTNHVRQTGIAFYKALRYKDIDFFGRMLCHIGMLAAFVIGGIFSVYLCDRYQGKALFAALIPLTIVLVDLLYADLKKEKGDLYKVPHGH